MCISGSIKGGGGMGDICPSSRRLCTSPPPVRRKKLSKSATFGKFLDFCPLRNAFSPLRCPPTKISGATGCVLSLQCSYQPSEYSSLYTHRSSRARFTPLEVNLWERGAQKRGTLKFFTPAQCCTNNSIVQYWNIPVPALKKVQDT